MNELGNARKQIDAVDDRIVKALAERRKLVAKVLGAKLKGKGGAPLRDVRREEELLGRLIKTGKKAGLDAHFVTKVFHEIIDDAVRAQEIELQRGVNPGRRAGLRVAYQGIEGAYSHRACQEHFAGRGEGAKFVGFDSFEAAVEAVESGSCDYAVLPVENTTAGSINPVYDLLARTALSVVGEQTLRIDHCLCALEDVPLHSITRILSHPLALAQCMRFLGKLPNAVTEAYTDTARAVLRVKEDGKLTQAAIASEDAARRYGLSILQKGVADQKDNFTRFLVLAKDPVKVDPRVPAKTSIIMATAHEEGALLKGLNYLAEHKINLTKLESRPRPSAAFQYLFYIDFEGNVADPNVESALEDLKTTTTYLKVLGSYPIESRKKAAPKVAASKRKAAAPAAPPRKAAGKSKKSYKLASREYKEKDTVIKVGNVVIGGPNFTMMAGPCAVESREQIFSCAKEVKNAGGHVLRGGCFKPRTSPYSFQGLGYEGLEMMAEAGRAHGLPIITEVLTAEDVAKVAETADMLQIGARNMQNFSLLRACGQVNRPVMLKRGMSATIEEFLNAAEYILAQGNHQVMLCERGIRTFETSTRNTLDLGAVPLLKRLTHLPIVVDPSHAAGKRELVIPLALAAHAVGPHALMVEIHPKPEEALSDGPQALLYPDFEGLMQDILEKA